MLYKAAGRGRIVCFPGGFLQEVVPEGCYPLKIPGGVFI